MKAMLMQHEEDPRQVLLRELGDLSAFPVYNNNVLLALYERPERTKSGLIMTQTSRDEEQWQGKAALVVALGETAFAPDEKNGWFLTQAPKLHDWIVMRPSDGWPLLINKVKCRMVTDTAIRMAIPSPDLVW